MDSQHIGIKTAQFIGEPITQHTLSFFHNLNDQSNDVNILDKIIHNNKENKIIIYPKVSLSLKNMHHLANKIRCITFNKIIDHIDKTTLYFDPAAIYFYKIELEKVLINLRRYWKLNNNIIYSWEAKVDIVNNSITLISPNTYINEHKIKIKNFIPNSFKIINQSDNNIIVHSNDSEYFTLIKNLESINVNVSIINDNLVIETNKPTISFSLDINSKIHVSGIKDVDEIDVLFDKLICYSDYLNEILNIPGVDRYKTNYYNPSCRELELGIENVRYIIFRRLKDYIDDDKYCKLLADHLTYLGYSLSVDRNGVEKQNSSFLTLLSYENNINVIKKTLTGVDDNLDSISAKILSGIFDDNII
ncbi:hypothetical protein BCR32DRAFT_279322 [Anaeromyces robustus]|uniref:DNA-directed RNA polymerase n=1 Tax=Anaeromyces robustus TaxID=1754192 RepID=A0A1Y1X849_9FUNG|nr:hypothetical protein BCR32DRAFT_279322 [Anaeromyces robustus]|eukprot:ORX81927.1 hypothetical protein BCR32DRAFT_279322 [Anaeromyces robustus]